MTKPDIAQVIATATEWHTAKRDDLAIQVLRQGLQSEPDHVAMLNMLAVCAANSRRFNLATDAYRRVISLMPDHPDAKTALARLSELPREIETTPLTWYDRPEPWFSLHRCLENLGWDDPMPWTLMGNRLMEFEGVALYGDRRFFEHLIAAAPGLLSSAVALIGDTEWPAPEGTGLPVFSPDTLPDAVKSVFLCESRIVPRHRMLSRLPDRVRVIDGGLLAESGFADIVEAGACEIEAHIYPLRLPEIAVRPGLDLLLVDCPARNLALLPNGIGYVDNALRKTSLDYQILDLDVVFYHRFQMRRLFDEGGGIALPSGKALPKDPWEAIYGELWSDPEMLSLWGNELEAVAAAIAAAKPKVLGLSVQICNQEFSEKLAASVRRQSPETVILAGGYNCYNPDIGMKGFPAADYMCIGEADLTVAPLVTALARGERPKNLPGVMSKFDDPAIPYLPGPMEHDLDRLGYPKYEWTDISLYQSYNGYKLTPVIASRGCRWSRCTFCAERFYWRIRSAESFVDELEWFKSQGIDLFMFNESDLNGMPDRLVDICEEVVRRGLDVKLTGQLRINGKCDRTFFDKLAAAGFVALRFGVDAFSDRTMRLQMKGYTEEIVRQNLKDCHEAGITVTVNWVIGVPGETEQDVDDQIAFLMSLRPYIRKLDNINQLSLANGSMYWLDPERYGIKFRGDKEALFRKYWRMLPPEHWYSEDPYIDENVRRSRLERAVLALARSHFPMGDWAVNKLQAMLEKSGSEEIRAILAASRQRLNSVKLPACA